MNPTAPLLVVFAGPNGAGKSTLRGYLFADSPIPFINADVIAEQRGIGAYEAAEIAEKERRRLFEARASFMFESVFSDPVGAKVAFLETTRAAGYHVIVHFVGLASPEHSLARVAQRVNEGGHDVPDEKIAARFPRVMANLTRMIGKVDDLSIFDNSSRQQPYRLLARFMGAELVQLSASLPDWIAFLDLASRVTSSTVTIP
jgi:predicted ABC-type ATPase